MPPRAVLQHAVQPDVDLPGNVNVIRNAPVTIYEPDGTTLLGQPLYSASTGGSPLANPGIKANNLGFLQVYAEVEQPVVMKVGGVSHTACCLKLDGRPSSW